jgi:hypothetical protein
MHRLPGARSMTFQWNRHSLKISNPLMVLTAGNVVSYEYEDGVIYAITFKFRDFYYKFDVKLQSIEEDPIIKTHVSKLTKPEVYAEGWSR